MIALASLIIVYDYLLIKLKELGRDDGFFSECCFRFRIRVFSFRLALPAHDMLYNWRCNRMRASTILGVYKRQRQHCGILLTFRTLPHPEASPVTRIRRFPAITDTTRLRLAARPRTQSVVAKLQSRSEIIFEMNNPGKRTGSPRFTVAMKYSWTLFLARNN